MSNTTKTRKTFNSCLCQCGTPTGGTFAPGHDARMVSQLLADYTANPSLDPAKLASQLPSEALRAKLAKAIGNLASKPVKAPKKPEQLPKRFVAKIGRYDYPITAIKTIDGDFSEVTYFERSGIQKTKKVINDAIREA